MNLGGFKPPAFPPAVGAPPLQTQIQKAARSNPSCGRGRWARHEDEGAVNASLEEEAYIRGEGGLVRLGLSDLGLSQLSGLQVLSLVGCQCVTDEGVKGVLQRSPGLRELDLGLCTGVTDETLMAVAQFCPDLRLLDVQRCIPGFTPFRIGPPEDDPAAYGPRVTIAGLEALVLGCSGLRELNLAGHGVLLADSGDFVYGPGARASSGGDINALLGQLELRDVHIIGIIGTEEVQAEGESDDE